MKVFQELEDEPTSQDLLGFERLANPIVDIIYRNFSNNTQTTIGVYGDWGSGKTSFLQMIEKNLRKRNIHPIWFYAWRYDKEDNLWAALIEKILDEAKVNGKWYRRAWVKFLIWKDSLRFHHGMWEVLKKISALFIRIILICIGLYLFLGLDKKSIEIFLLQWFPNNPVISTSLQANIVKIFGIIMSATATGTGVFSLINLLNTKLGIDFSKFAYKPSYKGHIAFFDEFSKEFEKIVHLLGQGKPLVVIIDDLDRCLPEKAIQVLEAIKNFLDAKGCVFILGLDRKLIEQAVAIKYKEIIDAEKNNKDHSKDEILQRRHDFYENYMDKIIQLSITLPRLSRSRIKAFVTNLSTDADIKLCASIFGVGLPPNPRKIKRILRTFIFVRDMLADDIIKGNIKISILAKLIVIQNQLPQIFEAVAEKSSLLEELESYYRAQITNQSRPDSTVELEKIDPLLREQAQNYVVEYPELRRILLEQIDAVDTFINVDIDHNIALVGALAEVRPYSEYLSHTSFSDSDTKIDIVELDDSLLRLLAVLPSSDDLEASTNQVIVSLLHDATQLFAGKVHRASLFLPDGKSDSLKAWAHFHMPIASLVGLSFYIGKDTENTQKRGVAGEAFLKKKINIVHITRSNDHLLADNNNYIDFSNKNHSADYRSFAAVPIIGPDSAGDIKALGVVCFDSLDSTVFDSPASQTLLRVVGSRIATVLAIYQQLLSPENKSLASQAKPEIRSKIAGANSVAALDHYLRGEINLEELKMIASDQAEDSKKAPPLAENLEKQPQKVDKDSDNPS